MFPKPKQQPKIHSYPFENLNLRSDTIQSKERLNDGRPLHLLELEDSVESKRMCLNYRTARGTEFVEKTNHPYSYLQQESRRQTLTKTQGTVLPLHVHRNKDNKNKEENSSLTIQ